MEGRQLYVGTDKEYRSIKIAIQQSNNGDSIIVTGGIYKEGNIIIDKSVSLIGKNLPVLDGQKIRSGID